MFKLLGRFKGWAVSITGALAVVVVVVTNIDKLATTLAGWLRPYLAASATIELVIDPSVTRQLIVSIMDGGKLVETRLIKSAGTEIFTVPANVIYRINWQGVAIQPAEASNIPAPAQKVRWKLAFKSKQDDVSVLALRLEDEKQDRPTEDASATTLAAVAAAQAAKDPASRPPSSNLLPELDRASLVVGLLETGSTNCSASVIVNQRVISVGCFGISIPGWLGDILKALATELPEEFAAAFEADSLAYVRAAIGTDAGERQAGTGGFMADAAKRDQLRAGLLKIVRWPAFRHHYEAKVLDGYGEALRIARQIGLRSERGVLLVFDNIISLGAGRARQFATRYVQSSPDALLDERTKVARYADFLRSQQSSDVVRRMMDTRLRLLISGKARSGGISFDLNELGIRDDADMLAVAPAAQ